MEELKALAYWERRTTSGTGIVDRIGAVERLPGLVEPNERTSGKGHGLRLLMKALKQYERYQAILTGFHELSPKKLMQGIPNGKISET